MEEKNNFFKDILETPIAMYYMLFKSAVAPILWGAIILLLIVFGYIVVTG